MRITSKGQVTIPKKIRDQLGVGPGSDVDFVPTAEGVRLVAVHANLSKEETMQQFRQALERVKGTLDLQGMTADEYFQFVRGPRAEVDPR